MDAKSFVIGFLLALCLMFALGSAEVRFQSSPGRFQVAGGGESWAILDTQSGAAQTFGQGKVTELRFKEPKER